MRASTEKNVTCTRSHSKNNFPFRHSVERRLLLFSDQVCKQRYHESVVRFDKQFKSELEALERMQPTAYEQIRFHRLFAITTLWPPLHTRKEIENTINILYKQNPRVARRVDDIMNQK